MKLLQGDCLQLMKDIPNGSVDMILCDLPYGTTACKWDIVIPFKLLWGQYYRILRPNGFIVLTASQPFTTKLINSNIDNFSHQWIWEKEQGSNPLLANMMPMKNFEDVVVFGKEISIEKNNKENFKALKKYFREEKKKTGLTSKELNYLFSDYTNKKGCRGRSVMEHYWQDSQFIIPTEDIYKNVLQKTGYFKKEYGKIKNEYEEYVKNTFPRVYNPQKTKGKKYKSGDGFLQHTGTFKDGGTISDERYPTSIIKFSTDKSKSQHPTQKPVTLFEYLIKTYTNENDLVLDNCMGSGTTGVACKNLSRDFIGMELNEEYFKIAKERIENTPNKLF